MAKGNSPTVEFRLREPLYTLLRERMLAAAEVEGEAYSPGTFARRLVVAALRHEHEEEVARRLVAVEAELQQLRADLATTLEVLLTNVASVSADEAQGFVDTYLRGGGA